MLCVGKIKCYNHLLKGTAAMLFAVLWSYSALQSPFVALAAPNFFFLVIF